jgi:GDPmannose 4,6-dehydratase
MKNKKKAIIFGVTGQDGSYLSSFLIKKNYLVYGVYRRTSGKSFFRLKNQINHKNFKLIVGDVSDPVSVLEILGETKPDEIYNLAAQSHVGVSFKVPQSTLFINSFGVLNILESIRNLKLTKKTKFYQAGTSEMFGGASILAYNELSKFEPKSPYGVSKVMAHQLTINYREAYNIFATNGILFNHESPFRGDNFVTKKIISNLCKLKKLNNHKFYLGNLYSKRDWGHAEDYVEAMWLILQQKKPTDFVISTGKNYTVKDFVNESCKQLNIKIKWVGSGLKEKAINLSSNKIIIEIKKEFFRPSEVNYLKGNSSHARKILKWKPKHNLKSLIKDMINHEMI